MACDPKTLAGDGCWNCLLPEQKMNAMLALLCQILQALDPMATCDPKTLAASNCTNCLTPFQKQTAIFQLLCEIIESLAGGLTTCCYSGNGSPEGVVTAAVGAVYIQIDNPGVLWGKVTGTGNTGWATVGAATYLYGNGSPEGVTVAAIGRYYVQQDAPGVIWVKISGAGNTGWALNS